MLYKVTAPDGRSYDVNGPEGASKEQVLSVLANHLQTHPPPEPEGGLKAAFNNALAQGQQSMLELGGRTGIRDPEGAQEDIDALDKYRKRTFKPAESFTEAPWQYTKELIGGSLPYMAPAAALAPFGALGGAALATQMGVSTATQTGANLSRQREENPQSITDTNLGKAATAGVGQGALDTVSMSFAPFFRGIFGITPKAAEQLAGQAAKKVAADYVMSAGKAATAEGLTEAAQQYLERWQADLPAMDDKAKAEYMQSFGGGALLGAIFGAPGRMAERSGIKADQAHEQRVKDAEEAAKQQVLDQQEAAKQEAYRKTPEYLNDLHGRFAEVTAKREELIAAKKKLDKSSPFYADDNKEAGQAIADYIQNEYKPVYDEAKQSREGLAALDAQQATQTRMGALMGPQTDPLAGRPYTEPPPPPPPPGPPTPPPLQEIVARINTNPKLRASIVAGERPLPFNLPPNDKNAVLGALELAIKKEQQDAAAALQPRQQQLEGAANPTVALTQEEATQLGQDPAETHDVTQFMDSTQQAQQMPQPALEDSYIASPAMDPVWEKALNNGQPQPETGNAIAPTARGKGLLSQLDDLYGKYTTAAQRADTAQRHSEPEVFATAQMAASSARQALDQHVAEGHPAAQSIVQLRDVQRRAAGDMDLALNAVRQGQFYGSGQGTITYGGATRNGLMRRAQQAKKAYIDSVMQEAAIRQRVQGKAFTYDQQAQVSNQLNERLGKLLAGYDEKEVEQPAPAAAPQDPALTLNKRSKLLPQEAANIQRMLATVRERRLELEPRIQKADQINPQVAQQLRNSAAYLDRIIAQFTEKLQQHIQGNPETTTPKTHQPLVPKKSLFDRMDKFRESALDFPSRLTRVRQPVTTYEHALVHKNPEDALRNQMEEAQEAVASSDVEGDLLAEEPWKELGHTLQWWKEKSAELQEQLPGLQEKLAAAKTDKQKAAVQKRIDRVRQQLHELKALPEDTARLKRLDEREQSNADRVKAEAAAEAHRVEAKRLRDEAEARKATGLGLPGKQHQMEIKPEHDEEGATIVKPQKEETKPILSADAAAEERASRTERENSLRAAEAAVREQRGEKVPEPKRAAGPVGRAVHGSGKLLSQKHQAESHKVEPGNEHNESYQREQIAAANKEAEAAKGAVGTGLREKESYGKLMNDKAALEARIGQIVDTDEIHKLHQALYKARKELADLNKGVESGASFRTKKHIESLEKGTAPNAELSDYKLRSFMTQAEKNKLAKEKATAEGPPTKEELERRKTEHTAAVSAATEAVKVARERVLSHEKEWVTALARLSEVESNLDPFLRQKSKEADQASKKTRQVAAAQKRLKKQQDVRSELNKRNDAASRSKAESKKLSEDEEAFNALWGKEDDSVDETGLLDNVEHPDDHPNFRTHTSGSTRGMPVDAVKKITTDITSKWKYLPSKVEVVKSQDDLPSHIATAAGDHVVPGVYDPTTGSVYVVADNVANPRDVALTLAHEIAGHFGLRKVLGPDYGRTMDALYENPTVKKDADAKIAEGLDRHTAVEEVLAEAAEVPPNVLKRLYYAIKAWLAKALGIKGVSDQEVQQVVDAARRYVERGEGAKEVTTSQPGEPVFRKKEYPSDVIGQRPDAIHNMFGGVTGLGMRQQFFDSLAPVEEGLRRSAAAGKIDTNKAIQANYFMRLQSQSTQAMGQFLTFGPVKMVADKVTKMRYEAQKGTNMMDVAASVEAGAKAAGWSQSEAEHAITLLAIGARANAIPNGWARVKETNPATAKAEYEAVVRKVNANPLVKQHMDTALAHYKKFNDGLIDFLGQTGVITKEETARLKKTPYAPFYRIENDVVKLFAENEHGIRIGNIKDNPDLKQMLGDDKSILPLFASAVQNAHMISRMGLRNKATHEVADALFKSGFASKFAKGPGPANDSTLHFKVNGEHYFATIDTDTFGIPAHMIAMGMEGVHTVMPAWLKVMGMPANWIRQMVTRSPAYVARQLIRDPINAAILGAVDPGPMLGAFKEMSKAFSTTADEHPLTRGLGVSSNIYHGDARDMEGFVRSLSEGRAQWRQAMDYLDRMALQSDAVTRKAVYADSMRKGMSEAEATMRALEIQNFGRHGLSPSMQHLNTIIPFFNAQLQGLDVLYRSFTGKMPFNDRLDIQRKLLIRGAMLAAASFAYASMMQDDPDYKKLRPKDRYSNFMVRVPGVHDFVRIPIPFEVGVIFKALPEAIFNAAEGDLKAKEAALGLGTVAWNSMPNIIPALPGPIVQAAVNQTAYGKIETDRERQVEARERYRSNTTEAAKWLGKYTGDAFGISPIMLEYLTRGYTGTTGLAMMHLLDSVMDPGNTGEKPSKTEADNPTFGSLFQRTEGRFVVDRAYERMDEINKAKKTHDEMIAHGKKAEAAQYAQEKSHELAMARLAGAYRKEQGDLFKRERMVTANPSLSRDQKDQQIQAIRAAQNARAKSFFDRTEAR